MFQTLSKTNQKKFIEKYFDTVKGIGYTLGRVPIGSCDFSVDHDWTYDDTKNDVKLKHFDKKATRDKKAVIPLIKLAAKKIKHNKRKLKILGSPWSAPAWMKTNDDLHTGGTLKKEHFSTMANY